MKISVVYTEDSIVGSAMGVTPAMVERFGDMLKAKIEKEWPGAEVEVRLGVSDFVHVDIQEKHGKRMTKDDFYTWCDQIAQRESEVRDAVEHIWQKAWEAWTTTEPLDMPKMVTVCGSMRQDPITIHLAGVVEAERLTPKLARQACRIVTGMDWGRIVWDNERGYGYALYPKTSRKKQAGQ